MRYNILILSIITCNTVQILKLFGSWDMPQWTHKYWTSKILLWLNTSVILKNMHHITKLIWHTIFSCKKYFMLKNIFVVSKKHEILAIFTYLIQRIQRSLSNIVISFSLHSLVTLSNTIWIPAQCLEHTMTEWPKCFVQHYIYTYACLH